MDFSLLKTFAVLAQTKNFTMAAQKLCRSQSTISLQISRLEEYIGKPLLFRTNRHVSLTVEGEQFLAYANKMLHLEQEMLYHLRGTELSGQVSFGIPEDLATAYLPTILSHFMRRYPSVMVNVDCDLTQCLLDRYEKEKKYDLILIKQDSRFPYPGSEPIRNETLVWVAHHSYKYHHDEVIPLVLAPDPCVYRKKAVHTLNKKGIRWRLAYSSPSLAGIIAAVEAGIGIGVLPKKMIPKRLDIVDVLPKLDDAQIAVVVQEHTSEAVKAFRGFIEEISFENI